MAEAGLVPGSCAAKPLPKSVLDVCYEKKTIGRDSPESLLTLVWFHMNTLGGLRSTKVSCRTNCNNRPVKAMH